MKLDIRYKKDSLFYVGQNLGDYRFMIDKIEVYKVN